MSTFVDITEFLDQAADELDSGELLFMPHFALYDAMSAIEIMDPRMDSALVPPGITLPEVPFTDSDAPLLAEEICWVLDRTMSAEMGWHSGYALSQTLYTSLYMHQITPISPHDVVPQYFPSWTYDPSRPIALVSIVMQAGLMAIVKTCDMVWRELSKGYVFDLEDFNADKSEVSLLEGVQVSTALRQLDKALAWLERWKAVDKEWQKALYHRIALRKHILLAVSNDDQSTELFSRSVHVLDALACYHSVRAGPIPSTPPPDSQLHASFDPTINRRLIVSMPLKVIELMPIDDAWKALQLMLEGMLEVCRMTESSNILDIMMLLRLRARLPPSPHRSAYVRSLNTTLLLHKLSPRNRSLSNPSIPRISALELFCHQLVGLSTERIRSLNKPLKGESTPPAHAYFEEMIERALMQHILSLCYNRPRMRRCMSKGLAGLHEIWEDAVDVAVKVREHPDLKDIKRLPLGIQHIRLANIVDMTFAGFETNLYAHSEWPLIYWNLVRVLGQQVHTMETLSRLLKEAAGSRFTPEHYTQSYAAYAKALRSLCHATLLSLFARPPKELVIANMSRPPTLQEYFLIERRFKWAFGSHSKQSRYADDAKPDLRAWVQFAAKLESQETKEVAHDAVKEFKEARVYLLNLVDQSVWKAAGGACNQLMHTFLTSCIKTCNAQISALEALIDSDEADGPSKWSFEQSSWFPTISHLISNE